MSATTISLDQWIEDVPREVVAALEIHPVVCRAEEMHEVVARGDTEEFKRLVRILLPNLDVAARLTAYAEALSAQALRGSPNISPDDVIRAHRASDMTVRRLHLNQRKARSSDRSLSDILRSEREREQS